MIALFAEHLGLGFILAALIGTWWICRREDRQLNNHYDTTPREAGERRE